MPLKKEEKTKIIKKFAQVKGDTGSPEVQVALITESVKKLQEHLDKNRHDYPAKRGLLAKISKRRRLLRYLAQRNTSRYEGVIKKIGLKK